MLASELGLYQLPNVFRNFTSLVAAQSTRKGGVSQAPYKSLNLGLFTEDDDINVAKNRQRFFSNLGISEEQTVGSYQVHQNNVKVVEKAGQWTGFDALITNKKSVFLTITIADCVPILIFDPVQKAVGAVHAGWRGTIAQVLTNAIRQMEKHYKTKTEDCLAFIGTCIDGANYEVGPEVARHFPAGQKNWNESRGKFFVDLKKANQEQLLSLGFPPEHIEVSPYSTVTHNDHFFSHRFENGITGRMLAVIGLKE